MIEFSRRHDGLFNVWAMVDGEWQIIGVHKTHQDALKQVREQRTKWRSNRDGREEKPASAAHHEPRGGYGDHSGNVQLGC
jgi:hypothetical protein